MQIKSIAALKDKLARRTENAAVGFRIHGTVFLAVNAFLIFINLTTSGGFPWFYFPLAGWGIGLLSHLRSYLNVKFKKRMIAPLKECSEEQYKTIRKLLNTSTGFKQHATAFLSVNGFLLGTNLITSPHYPWFLYPLAGWGIGMLAHWSASRARLKLLSERLKAQGIAWPPVKSGLFVFRQKTELSPGGPTASSGDKEILEQAREIKEFLFAQAETDKEARNRFKQEVQPLLDTFLKQIGELVRVKGEVTEALTAVSEDELLEEIRQLKARQVQSSNTLLKREYENSLQQYEHHKQTIDELKSHKELIELRLSSSLTALKQLKLDVARIKTISSLEEPYSLRELKNKSQELSTYLTDLRDSYKELDLK